MWHRPWLRSVFQRLASTWWSSRAMSCQGCIAVPSLRQTSPQATAHPSFQSRGTSLFSGRWRWLAIRLASALCDIVCGGLAPFSSFHWLGQKAGAITGANLAGSHQGR
jgi:hypothetical protein